MTKPVNSGSSAVHFKPEDNDPKKAADAKRDRIKQAIRKNSTPHPNAFGSKSTIVYAPNPMEKDKK